MRCLVFGAWPAIALKCSVLTPSVHSWGKVENWGMHRLTQFASCKMYNDLLVFRLASLVSNVGKSNRCRILLAKERSNSVRLLRILSLKVWQSYRIVDCRCNTFSTSMKGTFERAPRLVQLNESGAVFQPFSAIGMPLYCYLCSSKAE